MEGTRRRFSRSRALSRDVLYYHRQVPTCAHSRVLDLAEPARLRTLIPRRISWTMLFLKAFGLVAERVPPLRQLYFRWPWPHLYEHSHSVAMLAIQREYRGEPWLFWGRFIQPEAMPLEELQAKLERYLTGDVERVFRLYLTMSRMPLLMRRSVWWWTLNVSGGTRARRTGTFFLTTLASRGVEIEHPPAFLTSNLTYGPLDEHGRSRVTLAYDHRLMDGSLVADCLEQLEQTLNGAIAAELRTLADGPRRRDAA
ncbi:MAG: hypothetical protein KY476_21420 [Planctomycetes bacterium]|nr:hypothetical protein [Planctomycetota bacterium]